MIKRLFFPALLFIALSLGAQCPQIFNGLGALSSNPYWISCSGSSTYAMGFQSNSSWGSYTLSWGDGQPNQVGASYTASTVINHTYTSAVADTFVVTLMVPSLGCTMTGVVVMEQAVVPSITLPPGGTNQGCVPANLTFSNSSSNVSKTTHFIWNFGDGSPTVPLTYTNGGPTIAHNYTAVNCQTAVTLQAWNYCTSTVTTTYSPVNIFGKDNPSIVPDQFLRCMPNSIFTFSSTSTQNCPAQNTFQRKQLWDFGQYWGNPSDSIFTWANWPPNTTHSISFPGPGTYSVQLRDSNACGVSSVAINISIFNAPTASVVAPAGNMCQGSPYTFTNASTPGYFYLWNFGEGAGFQNLGAGNQAHTYSLSGTYTLQVAAFLAGGGAPCTSTASIVINILPQPAVGFSFTPGNGCTSLNNVTFTDISIGATSWNWGFANGNTSTLQVPPAQNYSLIGSYQVSLSITGANGCTNTLSQQLNVYPTPTANFSPLVSCAMTAVNFTNSSVITGTNPITSYTWDFADGFGQDFTQNPTHTFVTAGVYNVSLTVSSAFCSATTVQAFTVNPRPMADFVISPTVGCTPFVASFTNISTGQTSNLWNFGVTPTATSNVLSPTFTYVNNTQTVQTYTAALYVTNAFGCVDSNKRALTVLPVPQISFTATPLSGCAPLAVTFSNSTIGATSYSWNFGDGGSSVATNPVYTYTSAGVLSQVYTVQLVATNSVGCGSTATTGITVFPKPNFTFSMNPNSGCSNLSVNFFTVTGATSYTWDFGDGSPVTNIPAPNHVFSNTTAANVIYTVTLYATNAFGCADTTTDFVTVIPGPVASFSASQLSGCSPLTVNFTNNSINNTTNSWNLGNGTSSGSVNASASYTNNPGSSNSSYTVHLVVSNASTCLDSITQVITLFGTPQASFALDTPACSPKVMTFTNSSLGGDTYSWDLGDGSTSTQTTPVNTYTAGGVAQNYSIILQASNINNCRNTYSTTFVVHPKPNYNIVSSPDSGCTTLKVTFQSVSGVAQYQWTFGDGTTSNTGGVFHNYQNNGSNPVSYSVQMIGKDGFGCADTSNKVVKVFPRPNALFAADPLSIPPLQPVSFSNQSTGAVTYNWLFGDGNNSAELSPTHVYQNPGDYIVKLVAYSNKGCRDTFQLSDKIVVLDENVIQVPNAFTPNQNGSPGTVFDQNDKSNDIFHANVKNAETFQMSIYSRWGELLFDTKNVTEGWDGYYKGKLCGQDVYVWKIKVVFTDGSKFDKSGDLTLIK